MRIQAERLRGLLPQLADAQRLTASRASLIAFSLNAYFTWAKQYKAAFIDFIVNRWLAPL